MTIIESINTIIGWILGVEEKPKNKVRKPLKVKYKRKVKKHGVKK